MKFKFAHNNLNVVDRERSLAFYKEALGLAVRKKMEAPDGCWLEIVPEKK